MGDNGSGYDAYRFVALRINTLGCLLLVTPVSFWSAVVGVSALPAALVWVGTMGARSANAWASARVRGLSGRAAAASAGWWRAAAVLILAVGASVLTAAALRALSPLGDWLGAPGIAKPVAAVLSIMLIGAIPGTAVVVARSRDLTGRGTGADELDVERRAEVGLAGGRRAAALVAATGLGVVNVVVLTVVTGLGAWVATGAAQSIAAVAVLAIAFTTPLAAVWYASRTAGSDPGR